MTAQLDEACTPGGLPWLPAASAATSVRLAGGRSRAARPLAEAWREAGEVRSLLDADGAAWGWLRFGCWLLQSVPGGRTCERSGRRRGLS